MPRYEITAPDGTRHEITAPDGATEQQAMDYFKQNWQSSEQAPSKKNNLTDSIGWGEAGLIGAGKSATRIGQGLQQAYFGLTGNNDKLAKLKAQVDEENKLYQPLQEQHPIATALGEALPSMAVPMGAFGTGYKAAMAAGAIPGALEYGSLSDRVARGAIGAAGAGIGSGVTDIMGRLNKPFRTVADPARDKLVSVFENANIPLSVAQKTGNKPLRWIDSALDNIPWTSERQLSKKLAQNEAFNKAISATYGGNDAALTTDALQNAKTVLGAGFSDLSARNKLNFTDRQLNEITQLKFDAQRFNTKEQGKIVNNYIDDLLNKVEPDGTISGNAYRKFDSSLGRKIRGTSDGDLRDVLAQVRDVFRNAMDDSISTADQQAWRDLRRKYANLQIVADAAKGSAKGDVTPAGLLQRVNSQNTNAKFNGGGELGQLARAGKEISTPLPDAGTAQRSYYMGLMGGGAGGLGLGALSGLLSPLTAASMAAGAATPIAVQKAMWGGVGSKYLKDGLINASPETETLIRRLGQLGGLTAAQQLKPE